MNYKNLFFSLFFIIFLGYMQTTPAMETKSQQQEQQMYKILFAACKKGNLGLVKHLIEKKGANVNAEDDKKITLLHVASFQGYLELVKYLINKGANVNADAHQKRHTPLLVSCLHCSKSDTAPEIIKILIENGANVNFESEDNLTPWRVVCCSSHIELVKLFLANGAEIDFASKFKARTTLHDACEKGDIDLEIVKFLVGNGANVNAEDENKITPLMLAICFGGSNTTKFLIQRGADVCFKTDMLPTALFLAVFKGKPVIVEYLLALFPELIDVTYINGYDFTALDMAYALKNETIVKLFTKHGVRTVSEEQAEANMRAFFTELDEEASQAQSKRQQKKQKKLQNQQRRELQNQNINNNVNKQNQSETNQKVNPTIISSAINNCVNDDVVSIILDDKPVEANTNATTSSESSIIISNMNVVNSLSSKSATIFSPVSCINNSSASNNALILIPKKQQDIIQSSCNRPVQVNNQLRQINNGYQVGHDAKLKWPRSLNGAKYDLMRDHLRQLKYWPEITGLDIKVLKGQSGMFRLRVGGYRVLFTVNEAQRRIIIHEIGLRKKVYRGL